MNQPSFLAKNKNRKPIIMFFHALMVSGVVSIPMYLFDVFEAPLILFLIVSHMTIDQWKSGVPKTDDYFYCIYIDQLLHLLAMCFVVGVIYYIS